MYAVQLCVVQGSTVNRGKAQMIRPSSKLWGLEAERLSVVPGEGGVRCKTYTDLKLPFLPFS